MDREIVIITMFTGLIIAIAVCSYDWRNHF